jgi:IS1 family transposase
LGKGQENLVKYQAVALFHWLCESGIAYYLYGERYQHGKEGRGDFGLGVEGCSVRSTVRMTGVSKGAILRLLESVGAACSEYLNVTLRNISAKRVQIDEIWSFVGCKQKNVTPQIAAERVAGDTWTFVAIEAQTKLVISWMVGRRDAGFATEFLQDVSGRLSNRVQLTTDGHKMYLDAVIDSFADDIDYAQLVKVSGLEEINRTNRRFPASQYHSSQSANSSHQ